MNAFDILERATKYFSGKPAIIFEEKASSGLCRTVLTYEELLALSSAFGGGLVKLGVKSGDHVAVFLSNIPQYAAIVYGCWRIGAVPVLLSSALKKEQVKEFILNSEAEVFITSEDLWAETSLIPGLKNIHEIIVVGPKLPGGWVKTFNELLIYPFQQKTDLDPSDTALILYTSGTTGEQKGAMLSHGNVISNVHATNHHVGMKSDDVGICFLPLFHCFGQNFVMHSTLNACGTLVLHKRFDMQMVLDSLVKNRVSVFYSVPSGYQALLKLSDINSFDSVRYFFTAADTMPLEVACKFKEKFGRDINEGWGLTETSPFATYNHDFCYKLGSVGTPIENVKVIIVDDNGKRLGPDEDGEIAVRGLNVFQGYFNDPKATDEALRGGWFFTGDIGHLDRDGYLFITDRKKDMIKVGGFAVWPREIEKFLRGHFGSRLKDVGIIGIPDEALGAMPFAFAVKGDDLTISAEEILAACREKLTGYQRLKGVKFVDSIPKTPTGKILKKELRQWPRD